MHLPQQEDTAAGLKPWQLLTNAKKTANLQGKKDWQESSP